MIDNSLFEGYITPIRLFYILTLVAFGIYFSAQTPLNDITKAYLEVACTKGGFTSEDINKFKRNLASSGYDPNEIDIKVYPESAINITSINYAKRGEVISIKVTYNKLPMIDSIFKKLGLTGDTKNKCERFGMSEKY